MVFITEDTWKKSGVEVIIVDNIKWLNETNIEEQLGRVNFRYTSRQYSSELRKQRQDLIKDCIKQPCRIFLREDLVIQLIMGSIAVSSVEFKSRLDFKSRPNNDSRTISFDKNQRNIFN